MRSKSIDMRNAPMMSRKSLAIGWRRLIIWIEHRLDAPLQLIYLVVGGNHLRRQVFVACRESADRIAYLALRQSTHLGNKPCQLLEFLVVGLDGVLGHAL